MNQTKSLLPPVVPQASSHHLQAGTPEAPELFTDTPEAYLVTDSAGTIQEANDAAAALLRTSPVALQGKPMLRYLARESRRYFLALLRRLRPLSHAEAWAVSLQPQHGPLINATLTVVASQDLSGRFFTLHCHLTDLPHLQHAPRHDHTEPSPAQHPNLSRALICTHDLNGTLLFVSRSIASALGYEPHQMLARNLATFLTPSEQHQFTNYLQLTQHGPPSQGLLRFSTPGGKELVFPYRHVRYEIAGYPLYVHLYATAPATYFRPQHLRMFAYEHRTPRTQDRTAELTTINVALQKEISDRKYAEQQLQQTHEDLERRVAARTVELSQANILLEREILERRQAQEALRDSEARYRLLSTSAPIGIAQADPNGHLVYTNARWQTLAGLPADDALGNRWLQAIHPQDRHIVAEAWASAVQTGCEFSHEWRFARANSEICWVYARATPLRSSDGKLTGLVSTLEDITAQKNAQAALQEEAQISRDQTSVLARTLKALTTEPALDSFLSQVLTAIAQQLKAHRACLWLTTEAEEGFSSYLTVTSDNPVHISQASPSSPDSDESQFWAELAQTHLPILVTDIDHESRLTNRESLRSQGIQSLLLVPLVVEDEATGWLSLQSTIVTSYRPEEIELAQALAQQIALALQLAKFAEQRRQAAILDERNRLAREIHDTLAQSLTAIVIQLEAAKEILSTAPDNAHAHIVRAAALAREGLTEARRSVRALRPQALDQQDLPTALEHLVTQLNASTQIPITFILRGTPCSLPEEVAANLLRISQEAIINAWKHAQPRTISLALEFHTHELLLRVQDDGKGFDTYTVPAGSGFGLTSMRERSERLGGQFTLTSAVGQGTEIVVRVPNSQFS